MLRLHADTFEIRPYSPQSGSQTFFWRGLLTGLDSNSPVRLQLRWPPEWTVQDVLKRLPEANEETARRMTEHDSFAAALEKVLIWSADGRHWQPVEGVQRVDDDTVTWATDGWPSEVHVATQLAYTWADLEGLLACLRERPCCQVRRIGRSQAGLDLHAVSVPAKSPDAPTVYVQAYQHVTEFTGPWVIDTMLRRLTGAEDLVLRQDVNWHFVPAVDVDALHYGPPWAMAERSWPSVRDRNPNRDWQEGTWPEVAAIRAWLAELISAGQAPAIALDLHNGWWKVHAPGSCYTLACEGHADPQYIAAQKRFVAFMLGRTDHAEPGSTWQHAAIGGSTFANWMRDRAPKCLAHTVEFSRHIWWDRQAGRYVDARPEHPARFAVQFADALHAFVTEQE